jgi:type IV leader peptidase family protein
MVISMWTVLGAMTGIGLIPLTRHLLIQKDRRVSWVWLGIGIAILFGLLAWRMPTWPDLLIYSAFVAFGVAASVVDIAEHRLPTRLVLPAYPVTLLLAATVAILQRGDLGGLARVALGVLILPGLYLLLALISRGGIGAGDVRLAGPVGDDGLARMDHSRRRNLARLRVREHRRLGDDRLAIRNTAYSNTLRPRNHCRSADCDHHSWRITHQDRTDVR